MLGLRLCCKEQGLPAAGACSCVAVGLAGLGCWPCLSWLACLQDKYNEQTMC